MVSRSLCAPPRSSLPPTFYCDMMDGGGGEMEASARLLTGSYNRDELIAIRHDGDPGGTCGASR